MRLLQRQIRPLRSERVARLDVVERVERHPSAPGNVGQALFHVLNRLVHTRMLSGLAAPDSRFQAKWPLRGVNWPQAGLSGPPMPGLAAAPARPVGNAIAAGTPEGRQGSAR